jgi:L,D-peptidoglycan transpeptidase YkuD (ErfK/YbiS/YcfS/YnhG family)
MRDASPLRNEVNPVKLLVWRKRSKSRMRKTLPHIIFGITLAGIAVGAVASAQAATDAATTGASENASVNRLLQQAHDQDHSAQAIVVIADAADGPRARLATYAFASGHWRQVMGPVPAVLGKRGISLDSREGDMKSPAGMFYIGRSFGWGAKPTGIKLPFTHTTPYDYWVDDVTSADYNRWETWYGDPHTQWKSFERLKIPEYQYAAVIRYNTEPIVKGRGSAIFFHIWPGEDGHTAGCTAVSKQNVLKVLKWLDPAKRPVIIQGTAAQLSSLAHRNRK